MTRNITLQIGDMHCPNCAMTLEQIEDTLEGVQQAEASYQKGHMRVVFDDSLLSEADIRRAVEQLGYTITAILPG